MVQTSLKRYAEAGAAASNEIGPMLASVPWFIEHGHERIDDHPAGERDDDADDGILQDFLCFLFAARIDWIHDEEETGVCDHQRRDEKDGDVGRVGYEINFNRYFYEYQPPRDLEVIEAEIKTLEKEIMDMLREVTE